MVTYRLNEACERAAQRRRVRIHETELDGAKFEKAMDDLRAAMRRRPCRAIVDDFIARVGCAGAGASLKCTYEGGCEERFSISLFDDPNVEEYRRARLCVNCKGRSPRILNGDAGAGTRRSVMTMFCGASKTSRLITTRARLSVRPGRS